MGLGHRVDSLIYWLCVGGGEAGTHLDLSFEVTDGESESVGALKVPK